MRWQFSSRRLSAGRNAFCEQSRYPADFIISFKSMSRIKSANESAAATAAALAKKRRFLFGRSSLNRNHRDVSASDVTDINLGTVHTYGNTEGTNSDGDILYDLICRCINY